MKHTLLLALTLAVSLTAWSTAPTRFVGGDISLLPSYEAVSTPYKTATGTSIPDLLPYLQQEMGWNACRVRLFVHPTESNPSAVEGVVQDLAYVAKLGKRIKDAGMTFMLDFHYSDTWADPAKQYIPESWLSLTEDQLADTVYTYTKHCLDSLVQAGAKPDFVQIGNEVSYGMLWRGTPATTDDKVYPTMSYDARKKQWERFATFLKNGARATRESCPDALIILHSERVAQLQATNNFYQYLSDVDYDIIGLSYYPFWHGDLTTQLPAVLENLHQSFPDKPIHIVETAYYNNYWPTDGSIIYDCSSRWPATENGQDSFLHDLITTLQSYSYVQGLSYWFPEENGCGGPTWNPSTIVISKWLNRGLFHPSTHRALKGLNRLQEFVNPPASVSIESATSSSTCKKIQANGLFIQQDSVAYSTLGQRISTL